MSFGVSELIKGLKRTKKETIKNRLIRLTRNTEFQNLDDHDNKDVVLDLIFKYREKLREGKVITNEELRKEIIALEIDQPNNELSDADIKDIRKILDEFVNKDSLELMKQ